MNHQADIQLDLPKNPEPSAVIDELTGAFIRHGGDEEYLKGMEMVVPGAGKVYGIRVPALRSMAKQVVRQYKENDDALAEIAEASWNVHSREHELVGVFILGDMRGLAPSERWDYGTRFLPQVTNWESCDQLCAALLGQALAEDPGCMDQLEGWVENENFWVRRAALVATVYVRRAKYDDEIVKALDARTLSMCEILLDDDKKYIRKAVDWAVREVIKRHYNLAFVWMLARAESGPSSTARSILNLAAKKLEEEDRTRLLGILYRD